MSTPALSLPSLDTDLIAPAAPDTLTGDGVASLVPGDEGTSLGDMLGNAVENSALSSVPVVGSFLGAARATGGSAASGWLGLRGITLVLGFLLIAAGLFSHPAVRETIVSTAKRAGEAAALA